MYSFDFDYFFKKYFIMKKTTFIILCFGLLLYGCSNSSTMIDGDLPEAPFNPFDTVDYSVPVINIPPPDSNSFLGIHNFILVKTCNEPGCHDGTFEPDFRTVQGAYNNLVYHPVFKNYDPQIDGMEPLQFRVLPGDSEASMFFHRISRDNSPGFEQMPATGNYLADKEIDLIRDWIDQGAADAFGNPPMATSIQPICYGVGAFLPNLADYRVDTIRGGEIYAPFVTFPDQDMKLWFLYGDNDLLENFSFGHTFTYNKIKFSLDRYDFSNAIELDLEVPADDLNLNSVYSTPSNGGFQLLYTHTLTINPADLGFESGDLVYMRTYVQDGDHSEPTEAPEDQTNFLLQNYFSFYLL